MRIVFMGSAPLACPSFDFLLRSGKHEVVAVVTQPDRPKGRKLRMSSCAVKAAAAGSGVPVLMPVNVNHPSSVESLRAVRPDLSVVVAYGQILGRELLDVPPRGCVNLHASLLPKYRGAAPIQWAIVRGERVTGVTSMFMNARMDAGDIIFRQEAPIEMGDTAATLHDRLAAVAPGVLGRTLDAIAAGEPPRVPQVEAEATLAPKLRKEDGRIRWTLSAREIYNRVRGFNPWPMCFCETPLSGKGSHGRTALLRVLNVVVEHASGAAGEVLDVSERGPVIGAAEGAVRLIEVQPEGGKPMSGGDFLHGHGLPVGTVLG